MRAERRGEARGRKAREEARSLSPLSAARGAQTPPFRAAQLSLCRGRWRGAGGKEGRAGAVGRGDYSISGRRIGCIQSQSGCKLGPWPGGVGCKGSAAGGWGADRKRRGEGLERGHRLQLSPRQLGAFAQTTPASSSWQLLSIAPSRMEPPPPSPPQLLSLTPRLSSGAQRNLSLSINFVLPVNVAPPLAPTPPFQPFCQEGLGHWQNPLREPADHKCQLCVLGPVKSLSSAQALRRPVHGSQGSPETAADTDHPHPHPLTWPARMRC